MKESQSKTSAQERDGLETIKAVAWAVFQHNNGGGSNSNRQYGAVLVHQATRFKIEAQMKNELERRSMTEEALPGWDAGSTLFDKYELNSVFKHLDLAFQSADTHQNVHFDGSEYFDETTAELVPTYSSRKNHFTDPQQHSRVDQTSRNGYGISELERPNQRNWLETVNESQRFRDSVLESIDESLYAGYEDDFLNGYTHKGSPKPKLLMNIETFDDICRDAREVVPQGKVSKTMLSMHTSNRWKVLNGRRCSFDAFPDDAQKDSKQSRKSKLLAIFRSKSGKDGTAPKPARQARIVPDNSQKGPKAKTPDRLRRSGEPIVTKVVADLHDSDSSDSANGDDYEAQESKVSTLGLKAGLHMLVPTFSRAVQLSSNMPNPNADEILRIGHGDGVPVSPSGRKKTPYSLNVTSPLQSPRRRMLDGPRDDFDPDGTQQHHYEYHHHYHHHHYSFAHEDDDYELTVQDIVRRVPRKSFEEMVNRLSIEEDTGLKTPRNSLGSPFLNTRTSGSKLFL